jgi:hypothetical protein
LRFLTGAVDAAHSGAAATHPDVYATLTLREARNSIWRRTGDQFGQPSQVLGDGGQNKLILGTSRAPQSKPVESQDTLEVSKPHLDLLALAPRLFVAYCANEGPGNVSGVFMDIARDLA